MLFETLSQPLILLCLLLVGFASGIVFDIANFFFILANKNKVLRFFLDVISTVLIGFFFFLAILKLNFGELRFYEIIVFVFALALERILLGKTVAKIIELCYNFFVNYLKKFQCFKKNDENKN